MPYGKTHRAAAAALVAAGVIYGAQRALGAVNKVVQEARKSHGYDPFFKSSVQSVRRNKADDTYGLYRHQTGRGHTVPIDVSIAVFKEAYPDVMPGTWMKVIEEAPYHALHGSRVVYVASVSIDERSPASREAGETVLPSVRSPLDIGPPPKPATPNDPVANIVLCEEHGFILNMDETDEDSFDEFDGEYGTIAIDPAHLESLSEDEQAVIDEAYADDAVYEPVDLDDYFQPGQPVWIPPEMLITHAKGMFGSFVIKSTITEPLKGWIDTVEESFGASFEDLMDFGLMEPDVFVEQAWRIYAPETFTRTVIPAVPGESQFRMLRRQFIGPTYTVYIPKLRDSIDLDHALIESRTYDRTLFTDIVWEENTRTSLLRIKPPEHPEKLDAWGVTTGLNAGTNNVAVFFGPHGSGKTLTAGALAEYLERPLYIAEHRDFAGDLEKGIAKLGKLSKRTGSVIFIDEGEVFIQDRSRGGFEQTMLSAMMLQQLDNFPGIIIIATNHAGMIDPGFNSRFPIKVLFKLDSDEKRLRVWQKHIPEALRGVFTEDALTALKKIELDGRQIRDALQYAAIRAANEELEMLDVRYVIEEANRIAEDARTFGALSADERPGQYL